MFSPIWDPILGHIISTSSYTCLTNFLWSQQASEDMLRLHASYVAHRGSWKIRLESNLWVKITTRLLQTQVFNWMMC